MDPSGLVKTGPTRIQEICVGVPTWHQAGPSQQHPLPPPSPLKLIFNLQCSHRGTHTQAVQAVGEVHTGMLQPEAVEYNKNNVHLVDAGMLQPEAVEETKDIVYQVALW